VTGLSETAALAAIGAAARELKLPTVRADAARLAETAVRERHTHLGYLAEILAAEVDDRTGRRRARRIAEARFPRLKRLADFSTDAIPGIAPQLATLATGGWIDAGQPVVALGDSGTGKTHLLIGLGLAACEQGRRVRYATTAALVNELAEAADTRQLSRVVACYGRLDLLLLDELSYVQLDSRGAELLFQIITERDECASIAIGTNLPFSEWGTVFPDPPPRRRDRRPGHLQRPHHRNRHPLLPASRQQDRQPRPATRPKQRQGHVTICHAADATSAASRSNDHCPAAPSSTAAAPASKRPTGNAADAPQEPPAPTAADSTKPRPQTASQPGATIHDHNGAKSLDDTHTHPDPDPAMTPPIPHPRPERIPARPAVEPRQPDATAGPDATGYRTPDTGHRTPKIENLSGRAERQSRHTGESSRPGT
jgi:DNA replication protein DnaC